MSVLKDAYTAWVAGITKKENSGEIWWERVVAGRVIKITVEPIDIEKEKYIIREYGNGILPYLEQTYVGEKLNGVSRLYFENMQLYHEINYLDDQLHGQFRVYYSNGQMHEDSNYLYGDRHGQCKAFFEDGRVMFDHYYDHGKLL